MHPNITRDRHLWMLIMQIEVSAWQDGRDAPEDYPEMSATTVEHRDQLLELINALVEGKDHRLYGLGKDPGLGKKALEEEP